LLAYFESAHHDARTVIHEFIGIDLHPSPKSKDTEVNYPSSLESTTLKGLFGEVLTGLITEAYSLIGQHDWLVPVFLFRFHDDASKYLFTLQRDPSQERKTIGRLGTDFIGIQIDDDGKLDNIISGEAKWRKTLTKSAVENMFLGPKVKGSSDRQPNKGIWSGLNKEVNPPNGLRELQIILKDIAYDSYERTIISMDEILCAYKPKAVEKTNLVVVVGGPSAKREKGNCIMGFEEIPEEYLVKNNLQIVEVVLDDGEKLITDIYNNLWSHGS
jgi:hypothetical protein